LPGRKNRPSAARAGAASGQVRLLAVAVVAAVWMVRVELAAAPPGVTLDGVKDAVAPVGKPLAASETALVKAPFCGVTVME
jgi:hypothetical protein